MVDGYAVNQDGGLWRVHPRTASDPMDWIVWHFTPVDNLELIAEAGALQCDRVAHPASSPGNEQMKDERLGVPVDIEGYPASFVGDHVPFYVAGLSPMLRRVCGYGLPNYRRGAEPLVFLGFRVGTLLEAGLVCCYSDRNATSPFVEFSDDFDLLPQTVDMDVLKAKWWNNIPDDPSRATRRAAEVLVQDAVPLGLLHLALAQNQATAGLADGALDGFDYDGTHVVPWMYY